MGRRSSVEKLNETQFDFLIRAILDGLTDREISSEFQAEFECKLPKSSLNRWRKKAGNELAERYRLKRYQANVFIETLQNQGIEIADKYQNIIENLEDHLLTEERNLIAQNPTKLLLARQREENFRLRRKQLDLKEATLEFEKEKFQKTQNLNIDKFNIATEVWTMILSYFLKKNPVIADALTNSSKELLEEIGEKLETI